MPPVPRPTASPPPSTGQRTRPSATDACPGALRLHAAADGPLARVRLPGGLITGAQLAVLGDLARRWGDGGLELTSRANVQLRALVGADPADLAARLSATGLLPSETHETVRNIAAPAVAGDLDRRLRAAAGASLRALIGDLDRRLCADPALAALPGRFLFALGDVPLDADVAAVPDGRSWAILFAGVDAGLRVPVTVADVVGALLAAAHAFLAERAATPGKPAWRLRELPDGPARVARRTAAVLGVSLTSARRTTPSPAELGQRGRRGGQAEPIAEPTERSVAPIGLLAQADGRVAVGAAVPLGRLAGAALELLTRADLLVITPWRGIVLPDLDPPADAAWLRDLAAAGLPVTAGSRWSGVTACAGRPGCAKALADVRADAGAATRFAEGLPVHWIGCERGCGSPSVPHVRVEATPAGYAVTRQPGGAAGGPTGPMARNGHPAPPPGDLGDTITAVRKDG